MIATREMMSLVVAWIAIQVVLGSAKQPDPKPSHPPVQWGVRFDPHGPCMCPGPKRPTGHPHSPHTGHPHSPHTGHPHSRPTGHPHSWPTRHPHPPHTRHPYPPHTRHPHPPHSGHPPPGNPPHGPSPGNPPHGLSPGNPPHGPSPGNPPHGPSPGNPPHGPSPGNPPHGPSPGNSPHGPSPGNLPQGPPTGKGLLSRMPTFCRCLPKVTEKKFGVKLRMNMIFTPDYDNPKSLKYRTLASQVKRVIMKILSPKTISIVKFYKGSIIVYFELTYEVNGTVQEDPDKALRDAMKKGELNELEPMPDGLFVFDSYTGVNLGQWTTPDVEHELKCVPYHQSQTGKHGKPHDKGKHGEHDKDKHGEHDKDKHGEHDKDKHGEHGQDKHPVDMECFVVQTRECEEVNNSCEGLLVKRTVPCKAGCSRMWWDYGCWRHRHRNVIYLVSGILVGVLILVTIFILSKLKKKNKKYQATYPSTSDIKQLADSDYCVEPLPKKEPLA